jgi:uncharacterized protein YbjT (DUF2867 family)
VDAIPYGYYRVKFAVEKMIEESGPPWTILRATQFHELVVMMLSPLAEAPVAVVPRGVEVQARRRGRGGADGILLPPSNLRRR